MAWTEAPGLNRPNRALRSIALFEGIKGLAALAIGLGLLELMHHDLRQLVLELVGHFGLRPTEQFPALLLHYADVLNTTPLDTLEWLLGTYLALRLTEAYGLWHQRVWAEWLGSLSGGMYVPFEVRHLWHTPDLLGLAVLSLNVLIVGYLVQRLWQRRTAR